MTSARIKLHAGQVALILALLFLWQAAANLKIIDPSIFGTPLGVATFLNEGLFDTGTIWIDAGWTLEAVIFAFLLGSAAAIVVGAPMMDWLVLGLTVSAVMALLVAIRTSCPSTGEAGMVIVPDARVDAWLSRITERLVGTV